MNKTRVFTSISEFIQYRDQLGSDLTVGFVPTMGALHEGHESLIRKAAAENDLVVVSIFINPTQFDNENDLQKYPKTFSSDLILIEKTGAQVVLHPHYSELYADNYQYHISENNFSKKLCGAHRKGHFEGVLTVVMKLLQIVKPHRAYFGEKDRQQLMLIKKMCDAFFIRTQLVSCPTVREADGLAMSSRNKALTPQAREKAPLIYKTLIDFSDHENATNHLKEHGISLEYLEEHDGYRYIAAHLGGVRLIDNVEI